ncbi:MAG TPA: hypothetical protein VHT48_07935 [Methylocella sp.]|nr:hypothetical protein [Methylocella sp.]
MVDESTLGDEPPAEKPKHDQEYFLALAAKGKDAWNAWRRDPANKYERVTFAGVDFSEAPWDRIDFSGFEFGDFADFSKCKWPGVGRLEIGGDLKKFAPGRACFTGAVFGGWASFAGAALGYGARCAGAVFGNSACFAGTAFGDKATFAGATFGAGANFAFAAFGLQVSFAGAAFGPYARFDNTFFKGRVDFTGTFEEQWARDVASALGMDEKARAALEKRHKDSWETTGSRLDRFLTISFSRARFDGVAVFSGRSFQKTANFTNARFYSPPDFELCGGIARIDFSGVYIGFARPGRLLHGTSESDVPVRLRRLRKLAEDTKNHDLARNLYIEERKAERGINLRQLLDELKKAREELKKKLEDIDKQQREVWSNWRHRKRARNAHRIGSAVRISRLALHRSWIVVMGVYWALADYGRSFARPAAWLGLSEYSFYRLYLWILAALMAKASPSDRDRYK